MSLLGADLLITKFQFSTTLTPLFACDTATLA
jgi:hypothetical protein